MAKLNIIVRKADGTEEINKDVSLIRKIKIPSGKRVETQKLIIAKQKEKK